MTETGSLPTLFSLLALLLLDKPFGSWLTQVDVGQCRGLVPPTKLIKHRIQHWLDAGSILKGRLPLAMLRLANLGSGKKRLTNTRDALPSARSAGEQQNVSRLCSNGLLPGWPAQMTQRKPVMRVLWPINDD